MKNSMKEHGMPFSIKAAMAAALLLVIIITHTGCSKEEPPSKTDFCLDTSCQITIHDEMDAEKAENILNETFKEIRRYEQMLSRTVDGSDVDHMNKANGRWTEVSDETIDVVRTANLVSHQSGGAFDITIGAVTDLWDFKSEDPRVPKAADIESALASVNYQSITIDGGRVLLSDSDARIDLGGVAKGYIADRAAEFMEEQGVTSAVINLGGNVVTIGGKAEDTPWRIGIERPFTDRTEIIGTIEVTDTAVVTSGIYERNFEQDGVLYHHILDPKTGYPVETDLEAVTVTAARGSSGFCDAVSTACLVLGREKALQLIEALQKEHPEYGLEAALIDKTGDIVQTDGMNITFTE